jgi:hypothetical protein
MIDLLLDIIASIYSFFWFRSCWFLWLLYLDDLFVLRLFLSLAKKKFYNIICLRI